MLISRASKDDAVLAQFLSFIANDIKSNPTHIHALNPTLIDRARNLVSDIEIDLDAPVNDKDQ